MKKLLLITSIFISTFSLGQTSISFYHLGNTTYQNTSLNPAWVPDDRFYLGLPGLSGVHFNFNSKLAYNDVIRKKGDVQIIDRDKLIGRLQPQNMLSTSINIDLFHLGYHFDNGMSLGLFANERVEADLLVPKTVAEYLELGNDFFLDNEIAIDQIALRATHFREIGINYAYRPTERLKLGLRAKLLSGMLDVSTPSNAKLTVNSSGEFFQVDAEIRNAALRSSGVNIYSGDSGDLGTHLTSNGNSGFAVDFGWEYYLTRSYSVAISVLDLGFINWKDDIENRTIPDTTFLYDGVDLKNINDIQRSLEDSLFSRFRTETNNEAYTTYLPARAYGSWIYHYDFNTDIYLSGGARMVKNQLKMIYGVGATRRFGRLFTGSLTATKLPQQFVNVGAAFAIDGGPVPIQFYMAADQVINFDATEFKAIDFRVGLNLKFGWKKEKPVRFKGEDRVKGLDTGMFLGESVKTIRRDGIYSVIKRQERRELEATTTENKKVNKENNGRGAVSITGSSNGVTRESITGKRGTKSVVSQRKRVSKKKHVNRKRKAPKSSKQTSSVPGKRRKILGIF